MAGRVGETSGFLMAAADRVAQDVRRPHRRFLRGACGPNRVDTPSGPLVACRLPSVYRHRSGGLVTPSALEAVEEIASRVRNRDRRGLARGLSWIEDRTPAGRALLDRLYRADHPAHRVGITGPPGSGKSTIVNELTRRLRARGAAVGILAVDPSSPFTGGAILGDRIRMQDHSSDPDVFIRSMASRGSLGGLAAASIEASELLEAAGFDWILLETVGVGQSEMEVVEAADTTVLVLVPESGDAVQVMKAGVMEGGDVFVINKYDREGGDRLEKEVSLMLELSRELNATGVADRWEPPICRTVALRADGIDALLEAIDRHRAHLERDPERRREVRSRKIARRLRTQLRDRLVGGLVRRWDLEGWVAETTARIQEGKGSPYALVDSLVARLLEEGVPGARDDARRSEGRGAEERP
ncbi:MAG: methylmalonyl Co-A mutase-associated GTPase MeaB [Candidatus Eisenbacteria bacterium]|nr:methylmalonyl Co-A mutase-associated GTPase MeaB [Candidatus Latescibacterota bacterium]MBD3303382.1 methylmalonyl Co-A mutase-associated GTPase MeaB [Candidatus Eisenbacteria bacterium]